MVEALWPMVRGIKEDGYTYGKKIHYADLVLGAIMVWVLRTREEDFEEIIESADIQE